MRIVHMISIIILWICIALNIHSLIRIRRITKAHLAAIREAHDEQLKFRQAAECYINAAEKLRGIRKKPCTALENEEVTCEEAPDEV